MCMFDLCKHYFCTFNQHAPFKIFNHNFIEKDGYSEHWRESVWAWGVRFKQGALLSLEKHLATA